MKGPEMKSPTFCKESGSSAANGQWLDVTLNPDRQDGTIDKGAVIFFRDFQKVLAIPAIPAIPQEYPSRKMQLKRTSDITIDHPQGKGHSS